MSEQTSISKNSELTPRTTRAVAAILGQTRTDELLRELNQSGGRNQSEQASFLAAESPFLRDIYERGGTVVDGVLTVPKENLSAPPEIEITTTHAAVERLTRITKDTDKAKELAPQLVEMGERIAGRQSDGKTRLEVFGWLYRTLEGKQELLQTDLTKEQARESSPPSESLFSEKWQQIVELSEALAALEPKDRLPENSLEESGENLQETETAVERDENLTAGEIYENAAEVESAEHADGFVSGGGLISFERIETQEDLPKIPENLSRADFEKLLAKMGGIDSQLEQGVSVREVLAPFKRYVEQTKLDNELRLVETEYVKTQSKIIGDEQTAPENYRFVAGRDELRELAADRKMLADLREQQANLRENIQKNFGENVDRAKVERSIDGRSESFSSTNQIDTAKPQKIELTEDEAELRLSLVKEKSIRREIAALSESINEREKNYRPFAELAGEQIPAERRKELIEKVVALELPLAGVLKEKYPELTARERNEKLTRSNTFEIRNPAEYLFLREAASRQFQNLRAREINNEYRKFENVKIGEKSDVDSARCADEHREKIKALKTIEPDFAYKIEGSKRIVKAEPSERAVADYKFAAEYARYQLKQPEIRSRHESAVYREYAARLETAETAHDVVREAYRIRQENHRTAGVWKNADRQERRNLTRPLSRKELTLLFLEQPPKNYTAEMSVLKYNFAHYGEAKARMTAALKDGNLQPGADAKKLAESLGERLNRRDFETQHKATKHFFESLKTANEKLRLKNEFDHRAFYENLPPHEKDWIYSSASRQKENLEYKIAYEREKHASRNIQPPKMNGATNEAAVSVRQEFAAGTLWHQAAILTSRKETQNPERGAAKANEKKLQGVGFLIHNQSEASNLRVAEWLGLQKSEELKTAGEILKTFALASREVENNRLTVTAKVELTDRVSAADYKNLFDRYFPADFEKLKEFRANKNEKFRLEQSRRDGQSALLDDWTKDAQASIYRADAPVKVFENERREMQEIERIKSAQIECRRAVEIKNSITLKYEEKLKKEFAKINQKVSDADLRAAIAHAFVPAKSETLSREQKAIFERAQDKISISDFEQFSDSTTRLEKGISTINQSFEQIAALRLENAQYKLAPETTEKIESLRTQYETAQGQSEVEEITKIVREKFAAKTAGEPRDTSVTLFDYVSGEEKEQARTEAHRQARIALEPAELNQSNQSSETRAKALEFADALEDAHRASLNKQSESEIADAFSIAEVKHQKLEEFLKNENESSRSLEHEPVTLKIYERELARNERVIAQAKIGQMIETGKLSLADLETKKAGEIFSPKERDEIKLEAGERTRENLEPKELWAKRGDVSEKLQQAALRASDNLERAHEIYHEAGADRTEVSRAFSALDAGIVRLKNERQAARLNSRFINFKTDFKRDLAQMFERGQPVENSQLLAAMTKGLLLGAMEKQNVQPEKIGISSDKLNEISMTISLAMAGDIKRERFAGKSFEPNAKSKVGEVAKNENFVGRQIDQDRQHVQAKPKQFERAR